MTAIYIVQGTTGEYSDRTDWLVLAYRSKEAAEEHARKAMLRAVEIKHQLAAIGHLTLSDEYKNEFDANMQMDYLGTEYTVLEVELAEL